MGGKLSLTSRSLFDHHLRQSHQEAPAPNSLSLPRLAALPDGGRRVCGDSDIRDRKFSLGRRATRRAAPSGYIEPANATIAFTKISDEAGGPARPNIDHDPPSEYEQIAFVHPRL